MGAESVRPLQETLRVEEQHQQERAQNTDRITGRAAAGIGSIEGTEHEPSGVQSKPQEYEGRLVPRYGAAAGLAPALELLRQGPAILSMRWGHRGFLLARKGKPHLDYGLIVPSSQVSG
jgi:hypothetical protein